MPLNSLTAYLSCKNPCPIISQPSSTVLYLYDNPSYKDCERLWWYTFASEHNNLRYIIKVYDPSVLS